MINIEKYIVKVCSETGEGSGFLLEGGYIVTANHNIRDGQTAFFILNELTNKFDQKLEIDNPGFVPIRKPKEEGDFAVFRLKYGEKLRHRSLSLLPEHKSTGKEFMCYGFPKDEAPTGRAYNNGKIDAIEQPHVYSYPRMNLLNTNEGVIKPGFSGSPIIDPVQRAVVGIILMEKDGVDVIGVGGAWIKQHLQSLPKGNGTVNRFFDKKIPNLDYHCFACNREDQMEQLNKYFKERLSQREHQHIFLFGKKWDRPESLVCRFLQELRSHKRPLQLDVPFTRINDAFEYLDPLDFPTSSDDLDEAFEVRLQAYNQHPKSDYVVFFWRLPSSIWKNKTALDSLRDLLTGALLKHHANEHRLLIFYWLEPENQAQSNWLVQLLKAKGHCRASQAIQKILIGAPAESYCLVNSWEAVTEAHLENWFNQFCVNIAQASPAYRDWLKEAQPLQMATVELNLKNLITLHNPDYQHLRS